MAPSTGPVSIYRSSELAAHQAPGLGTEAASQSSTGGVPAPGAGLGVDSKCTGTGQGGWHHTCLARTSSRQPGPSLEGSRSIHRGI